MERAPLSAFRVVAGVTSLAGLLTARHLADLGAEVAVIEAAGAPAGAHRASLLRNTFSTTPPDAAARSSLIAAADVVLHDGPLAAGEAAGAVRVAIPGSLDESTDEPTLVAAMATGATCAALFHRRMSGAGVAVTVDAAAIRALLALGGAEPGGAAPAPSDPRQNAHLRARGFWEQAGDDEIAASPWTIGGTSPHTRTPAPAPGEHTALIRERFAGRPAAQP